MCICVNYLGTKCTDSRSSSCDKWLGTSRLNLLFICFSLLFLFFCSLAHCRSLWLSEFIMFYVIQPEDKLLVGIESVYYKLFY